jgi:hypothetical protein
LNLICCCIQHVDFSLELLYLFLFRTFVYYFFLLLQSVATMSRFIFKDYWRVGRTLNCAFYHDFAPLLELVGLWLLIRSVLYLRCKLRTKLNRKILWQIRYLFLSLQLLTRSTRIIFILLAAIFFWMVLSLTYTLWILSNRH